MIKRIYLTFAVMLVAMPVWSQSDETAPPAATNESPMMTPPPVSGLSYPVQVSSEQRSNYLGLGVTTMVAFDDNVLGGYGTTPVRDTEFSIWPKVTFDRSTSRFHPSFAYTPAFTFYEPTSSLDAMDQNFTGSMLYDLTPHSSIVVGDTFLKTSDVFNQAYGFAGGGVSASGPTQTSAVIAPFAEQIFNTTSVEYSYQFGRNSMIGAIGQGLEMDYPNPNQVKGLYNSNSWGGSVFYSKRLSPRQYVGVTYQYLEMLAYPAVGQSDTTTDSIFPFYTLYLRTDLSFSVSGGPEYFQAAQTAEPTTRSWEPDVTASMGWQGQHTSLAASYSRNVTGGGGLLGAFDSNSAALTGRWQMSPHWTASLTANYTINKTLTPGFIQAIPGGHTFTGIIQLDHPITGHLLADAGYDRLDESYSGVAVITGSPNSDRVYVGVSYQLRRPLGR